MAAGPLTIPEALPRPASAKPAHMPRRSHRPKDAIVLPTRQGLQHRVQVGLLCNICANRADTSQPHRFGAPGDRQHERGADPAGETILTLGSAVHIRGRAAPMITQFTGPFWPGSLTLRVDGHEEKPRGAPSTRGAAAQNHPV
jgi:hypothetical protein